MPPKRRAETAAGSGRQRKRARTQQARSIDVERSAQGPGSAAKAGHQPSVDVERLVKTRSYEINALSKSMRTAQAANSQRAFQTVPRHLRRRAASHNARRLPLRLRARAKREIAEDATKKPPRRKVRSLSAHKRRVLKFVGRKADLKRRSVKSNWLETHLWHAKRMHMADLWGHRIALAPTQKSFRASHRASTHGALVQDTSYTHYLQLRWTATPLRQVLTLICDPLAVTPCSARYTSGARVCRINLYSPKTFPRGLIGPITLLWKPATVEDGELRTLLISFHPAMAADVIRVFRQALEPTASDLPTDYPIYGLVAPKLCSFTVDGRRAGEILGRSLVPAKGQLAGEKGRAWPRAMGMAPDAIASGMVIGVVTNDPRLSYPPKPPKSDRARPLLAHPSTETARCDDFWETIGKCQPVSLRYNKAGLDARRSQSLLPGTRLAATALDDRLPVLLYRHEPNGYTLLAPAGWANAIFLSLVHADPRVGGQQALAQRHLEAGLPHFPLDYPSTPAYNIEISRLALEAEKKHLRRPPAKRISYGKLGTPSPFRSIWPDGAYLSPPPSDLNRAGGKKSFVSEDETKALVSVRVTSVTRGCPDTLAQLFPCPSTLLARLKKGGGGGEEGVELMEEVANAGPVGHVTSGGFSLARGRGHGVGAVTVAAYRAAILQTSTLDKDKRSRQDGNAYVLFMNASTQTCRLARLTLITS